MVCEMRCDGILLNVGEVIAVVFGIFDAVFFEALLPSLLLSWKAKPPLMYCMAFSSEMSGAGVRMRWM